MHLSLVDGNNPATPADEVYRMWTQFLYSINGTPALDDDEAAARGLSELNADADDNDTSDEAEDTKSDESTTQTDGKLKKKKEKKMSKLDKLRQVELLHGSDVVGVIFLEVRNITDLPPEHNSMSNLVQFLNITNRKIDSDTNGIRYGPICCCISWEEDISNQARSALLEPRL